MKSLRVMIGILLAGMLTAGCKADQCREGPAQAQIDVLLAEGAASDIESVAVTLVINGGAPVTRSFARSTPSFVFDFKELDQPPRSLSISAVARGADGRTIATGQTSVTFTSDACNFFAVTLKPGGADGGSDGPRTDSSRTDSLRLDSSRPDGAVRDQAGQDTVPACEPNEKPSAGVFVSPVGNDATGDGTAGKPLATIGQALKLAATGPKVVYLDQGTYAEAVQLSGNLDGITVRGGWKKVGVTWERDCGADARDKTLIDSPTNVGVSVGSVALKLDTLTVLTKAVGASLADAAGESVYGVFVTGDSALVTLANVHVAAGKGGAGGVAQRMLPGLTVSCNGLTNCSDGLNGASVSNGADAQAGTFGALGYVPGDANDGKAGNAGHNGTQGAIGATLTGCKYSGCAGDCVNYCGDLGGNLTVKGDDGTCGCGGNGGSAGGAGRGGGGSIALFASGKGVVTVVGSALEAATGGDGSPGHAGAAGISGITGAKGAAKACWRDCYRENPCGNCSQNSQQAAGGAAGGPGGTGSAGSAGGGGSGGPSIAVVRVGGAIVTLDAASQTACTLGGKGAGSAPAGVAQKELVVP